MRSSILHAIIASCVAVQAAYSVPGNTTASTAWPVGANATVTVWDPECGCTKTAVAPPASVSPTLPATAPAAPTAGYTTAPAPAGQAPFTGDATKLVGADVTVALGVAMLALGL